MNTPVSQSAFDDYIAEAKEAEHTVRPRIHAVKFMENSLGVELMAYDKESDCAVRIDLTTKGPNFMTQNQKEFLQKSIEQAKNVIEFVLE
jgi:hypothetical protein